MRCRWDQGRLDYYRFDNILRMATVLAEMDGVALNVGNDPLRKPLVERTGLGFKPDHYRVWRNYARVFRCSLLATDVSHRLAVTALCRKLADPASGVTPDEYLNFVFSRFALPFPAFDDYNASIPPAYPFSAIVKFAAVRGNTGVSLQDAFSYVVGNDCMGIEDLSWYQRLAPTGRKPQGDEERQVREMLAKGEIVV